MAITEKQITELEAYFKNAKLPATVQLDAGSNIEHVPKFIASHLNVLRNNAQIGIFDVF